MVAKGENLQQKKQSTFSTLIGIIISLCKNSFIIQLTLIELPNPSSWISNSPFQWSEIFKTQQI